MYSVRNPLRWLVSLGALVTATTIAAAQMPAPGRLLVLLRDASALAIVDPASGTVLSANRPRSPRGHGVA